MKIGCVKEIKNNEFRVGLTPDNVKAYIAAGHHVYIEKGAGLGSGFSDNEYVDAGASLIDNAADVWHLVDMMVKVKEPLESEYPLFREGLILYTYLHPNTLKKSSAGKAFCLPAYPERPRPMSSFWAAAPSA